MLDSLPLHPAVVHLPIGISFLLPLVTLLIAYMYSKSILSIRSFLVVTFLHMALVGASYAALETGEEEEDRVEQVVAEHIIEGHEEKAEVFMVVSVVAFAVSLALVIPGIASFIKPVLGLLLILQLGIWYLGYEVGHTGGEMVYKHGATKAYENQNSLPSQKKYDHDDDDEYEDD